MEHCTFCLLTVLFIYFYNFFNILLGEHTAFILRHFIEQR